MLYWHPTPTIFVERLRDAIAVGPEAVTRALQDIGVHLLTYDRIQRHGPEAVPSCRTLAAQVGGQRDRALRVRQGAIDFHASFLANKNRGQAPSGGGGEVGRADPMADLLARLQAAEERIAVAEARATAAEAQARAAEVEAARRPPDASPTPARQLPDANPTDARRQPDRIRQPPDNGLPEERRLLEKAPDSRPTGSRRRPDSAPTPPRQPPDGGSGAIRARGITNTQHTNNTSQEGEERSRPRDPTPPPSPLGREKGERGEEAAPTGSAAAVLAGWEGAWRKVFGTEPPLPQPRGDARAAATLRETHPGLDVEGYTALAERYLRLWATNPRRWPADPTPSTWARDRTPGLVLAPALPPAGWDDDPLDTPPPPSQPERPAWVSAAEKAWWELAGQGRRFLLAPSEALVAWWAEHDPEALQAAEGVMGYPLVGGEEVAGGW